MTKEVMQQAFDLIERLNQLKSVLCDPEGKCCIAGSDEDRAIVDRALEALAQPPLPVQEPVTWDKPSASFDEWWDGDRRRDNANPFTTDSFSYWAFEGWQAALAQRPWQGLTEEEIAVIGDKVANEDLVGLVSNFRVRLARAIEQTLKERNT